MSLGDVLGMAAFLIASGGTLFALLHWLREDMLRQLGKEVSLLDAKLEEVTAGLKQISGLVSDLLDLSNLSQSELDQVLEGLGLRPKPFIHQSARNESSDRFHDVR